MSILDYFPYPDARDVQADVLQHIEDTWDQFDCYVLVMPTASGKSSVAKCIMDWLYAEKNLGASYIAPTNLLVDQFLQEFPDTPRLHRLDAYWCEEWQQSCAATRGRKRGFCKGCFCSSDLATAKYRRGPGVYNYHTYLAQRIYRPVLIIDEAHGLAATIQDRLTERLWVHDYLRTPVPSLLTPQTVGNWLGKLTPAARRRKRVVKLVEAVEAEAPRYVIQRGYDEFNGAGTRRGYPEERPCIRMYPVDISDSTHIFFPSEVRKVILMSATINYKSIEELGLDQRRVCYINARSPIPPERRPVHLLNTATLSRGNLEAEMPRIAAEIENIAAYHSGEKGLIHATYQMADYLRTHLPAGRYLFHTRENKGDVYREFRESSEPRVLVGSGLFEGIDLPYDAGRWQVIAKCPWPSLGDAAIRYKSDRDADWYRWKALRDLIQACGRICRRVDDYGASYCLDGSVNRLLEQGKHLVPDWFLDSMEAGRV